MRFFAFFDAKQPIQYIHIIRYFAIHYIQVCQTLPYIAYKYGLRLKQRRGARRDFKDRSEVHGLGVDRGKRHYSPLLTSMVRSRESGAKGRGSRWSVISSD